jgi:N-acetyl-1-D-myo-inositol-2-amino-2-deoxy-alpha-D-glucopyranoside deacetylase
MRAAELAAVGSGDGAPWTIAKIYWNAMPESWLRDGLRRLRASGDTTTFEGMDPDAAELPYVVPDELVTAVIDGMAVVDAKMAAMRAHATQITLDGPFFALSNNMGNEVWGLEAYRLVQGRPGPSDERDADGRETDLFSGLD